MPKRRKAIMRTPKSRLHIFCEGKNTEPFYLQAYIDKKFPETRLQALQKCNKNTPLQLVQSAVVRKGEADVPDDDSFWVVYDREAINKYSNELHAQARDVASRHGINIALSNVCFEVWILLHFQDHVAAYTSFADLERRSLLKQYLPGYDKGCRYDFTNRQIEAARRRAARVNECTKAAANRNWTKEHQWNPYTDVYKLLDDIDKFGS